MSNPPDKVITRARPIFLYVIYAMILAAIPLGILGAFKPDTAKNIAESAGLWLKAIPDSMWVLFGVGYTGYAVTRSYDKSKGVSP